MGRFRAACRLLLSLIALWAANDSLLQPFQHLSDTSFRREQPRPVTPVFLIAHAEEDEHALLALAGDAPLVVAAGDTPPPSGGGAVLLPPAARPHVGAHPPRAGPARAPPVPSRTAS